jgi:hypothetical protein
MTLEDRLIMEKSQIEAKKEMRRRELAEQEVSVLKDRPFVRESSAQIGIRKIETRRMSQGLSMSLQKHEELYLDYQKRATKRDFKDDEIKLKLN